MTPSLRSRTVQGSPLSTYLISGQKRYIRALNSYRRRKDGVAPHTLLIVDDLLGYASFIMAIGLCTI